MGNVIQVLNGPVIYIKDSWEQRLAGIRLTKQKLVSSEVTVEQIFLFEQNQK